MGNFQGSFLPPPAGMIRATMMISRISDDQMIKSWTDHTQAAFGTSRSFTCLALAQLQRI